MIAIYPGSFDPLTVGHLEIIRRAAKLFDEVIVCILVNPLKHAMFSPDDRLRMIKTCIVDLPNVSAMQSDKALFDVVNDRHADAILRGIRSDADYQLERPVADAFLKLCGLETIFIQCNPEHSYVSSSLVREMMNLHLAVDELVPKPILLQVTAERSK